MYNSHVETRTALPNKKIAPQQKEENVMKKIISLILALTMLLGATFMLSSCNLFSNGEIYVQTNAYFAPFEYYDGSDIVGVDIEIMEMVGKKLNKDIVWQDGDFGIIIDTVAAGQLADCGAAGLTITDERKEKVDFSIPYYTSIQYVILPAGSDIETKTVDGTTYIVWEALAGKTVATQTDTTGWIYADCEIDCEGGVLYGTNTKHEAMDSANVAAEALGLTIDAVIVDQLPAQFIVSNSNKGFVCYPLYYSGAEGEADAPVEEQYAIAVTKGNDELLEAINEVLAELLVEDENGVTEIEKMVMSHMGMN